MLQIRKCAYKRCCTPELSNIAQVLGKFVERATDGMKFYKPGTDGKQLWSSLLWRLSLADFLLEEQSEIHPLPFHYFCSTRDTISKRYCKLCAIYFVTQTALQRHKKEKFAGPQMWKVGYMTKMCTLTKMNCWH